MSPGEIAGIVTGAVLGGAALASLVICLIYVLLRKRNKQSTTVHNQQLDHPPEAQDPSEIGAVQEFPGVAAAQELPGAAVAQELPGAAAAQELPAGL